MNAEVLQIISIVAFSLAGLFLISAIILFFKLNIRSVVDDLSGKKAERQIKELRELNQQSNANIRSLYQPSTGKHSSESGRSNTLSLNTEKLPKTDELTLRLQSEEDTERLEEGTAQLEENVTSLLEEETDILEETGTDLLEEGTGMLEDISTELELQGGYRLLINEILIHTKERI